MTYLVLGWCSISAAYAGSHRLECVAGTTTTVNYHICTAGFPGTDCVTSDPNDTLFISNAPQGTKVTFITTYENYKLKANGTAADIPFSVTFDAPNTEFSPAHHDANYADIGSQDQFITFAQGSSAEKTFSLNILQPGGKADHLLDVKVMCERPVQQTGSITIKKQASGGDSTFTFNVVNPTPATGSTIPSPVSITTSSGQGSSPVFSNLGVGSYQITENDPTPAGFKLDNITCDSGGPQVSGSTVTVNLTGGANINCTFTNSKIPPIGKGTLVIVKNTGGPDATFNFNASGGTLTNFPIVTSGGTGNASFTLNPGSYSVAEVVPANWSFVNLACTESGGTNSTPTSTSGMTATIGLDANETVTCTYTNKTNFIPPTTSSITFRKQIAGGGPDSTFNFTAVNPATTTSTIPASFSIATSGGAGTSPTFNDLSAGQYQITESDPTGVGVGFKFDSVSCDNGASSSTSTLTINLAAGLAVICTFTNSVLPAPGTGSITIIKNTNGPDATFSFTASGGSLANFSITTSSSTGNKAFNNLPAGNYTVTENVPPQWNFVSLVCVGDIAGKSNTTSVTSTTAHIGLDAGEDIVCTYTNKSTFIPPPIGQTSSLTIVKTTNGHDGTFGFSSTVSGHQSFTLTTIEGSAQVSFNITAGTYSVTETSVGGTGWSLKNLNCIGAAATSVNIGSRSATVSISSGTATICVFENFFDETFIRTRTSETIRNFMNKRADLIVSEEPDRNRFIRRLAGSLWGDPVGDAAPFTFSGSSAGSSSGLSPTGSYASVPESTFGQMKFSTSMNQIMQATARAENPVTKTGRVKPSAYGVNSDLDVWLEAHYGYSKESRLGYDRTGNYGIVYGGADYLLGSNLLVGALVQVDSVTDNWRTTGASVKGTGWMSGPYATWRLSQNLFLDGRVAWGESSNKVSPFGTYEDKFDTQRGLARVNLTGNWVFNDFRVSPSVALTYFNEHQLAYTDSLGIYIPSQSVSLGRVTFGPEIGYRFSPSPYWTVEPHVAVMGLWDFQKDGSMTIQDVTVGVQPIRARVQGGIMARNTDNFALRWTVSYDGIGDRSLNVYGTQLWLNVPLRAADNVRWPVKAPPVRWMGAYGGIQFGASQANFRNDFLFGGDEAAGAQGGSADRQLQPIGGIFAGYNYRWDKVVAGVEADVAFRKLSATDERLLFAIPTDSDDRFFASNKLGTTGSLRARLGYAWNKSLLYGTAGIVLGRVQTDIRPEGGIDQDLPAAIYSQSAVRLGWTAGAGVEHSINDNWFVRGEFRYSQFGAKSFSLTDPALQPEHGPNTNNNSVSLTQGLFGIGYRF